MAPSKSNSLTLVAMSDDDDDFQNPTHYSISLTQNHLFISSSGNNKSSTTRSNTLLSRSSKKPKRSIRPGKENIRTSTVLDLKSTTSSKSVDGKVCDSRVEDSVFPQVSYSSTPSQSRVLVESTQDSLSGIGTGCSDENNFYAGTYDDDEEIKGHEKDYILASIECSPSIETKNEYCSSNAESEKKKGFELDKSYLSNSIESRLLGSKSAYTHDNHLDEVSLADFEPGTQLNVLMDLCSEIGDESNKSNGDEFLEQFGSDDVLVKCPLCGIDISHLSEESRLLHSNECLDRDEIQKVALSSDDTKLESPQVAGGVSPVVEWLRGLGLTRYEEAFVTEEVDWETLQCLTEEDLLSIGVTALGPRKKIMHALNELRKGKIQADGTHIGASRVSNDETNKLPGNKLITEYFGGSFIANRNRICSSSSTQSVAQKSNTDSGRKRVVSRNQVRNTKIRDIPSWCSIPGTPFRVDAFKYLRGDCAHWFLTHFHIDHYQGLTKSFCHGKIYCSLVTARLVNTKIGVPWDRLEVLPLNQKISIGGVNVTCLDANHCPGSIIILFEPTNGKAVLHTGDFRFSEQMANDSVLSTSHVDTLILDTTYCNPQYDFPKQETVIQFVIDAIQAEEFNPRTLFLIGSYTIGKERLFLEVGRCLRKKVYVGAAKLNILKCLGFPEEDMQWFTSNEHESHIHVVPMWTIASFKRMKHITNQYTNRFSLIVAISPTGWSFGKGKKKSPGKRWKQGTIIRYEVPYSEHCSFTELQEFVKFLSPQKIIPSVNNDGPESANSMITLLTS